MQIPTEHTHTHTPNTRRIQVRQIPLSTRRRAVARPWWRWRIVRVRARRDENDCVHTHDEPHLIRYSERVYARSRAPSVCRVIYIVCVCFVDNKYVIAGRACMARARQTHRNGDSQYIGSDVVCVCVSAQETVLSAEFEPSGQRRTMRLRHSFALVGISWTAENILVRHHNA